MWAKDRWETYKGYFIDTASSLVDCSLVEREVAQSHRLQRESFVKTFFPRVVPCMEGPAAREACLKMGPEWTLQAIPNPSVATAAVNSSA